MNAIEHLQETAWQKPDSYFGFNPIGDYCILSRNRDSALLEQCNWTAACEALRAEAYDGGAEHMAERPAAYHWRAGHWACGWVEYLMIRADAPEALQQTAGEILCALADYPVLDEDAFCTAEYESVCERWQSATVRDRAEWCKRFDVSIFAARRDELPRDDNGMLFDYLRTE